MRERATYSLYFLLLCAAFATGCEPEIHGRRAVAGYDMFTSRLVQLSADQNGDGRVDQWTYLDGTRPIRGEADIDGDGRIDRWEYFDASASLVMIGSSSLGDGVEDTWTFAAATATGEMHVARSLRRDRASDRHEYFRGDRLIRVEQDTNGDGRLDRWERFENAVLREAAFDTSLASGRPDRRVLYDASGKFSAVEVSK